MRSFLTIALVGLVLPAACRSSPKAERSGTATAPLGSAPASEGSAVAPSTGLPMTARLIRCGWGPVKAEPGVEAPPFAVALLDVEVRSAVQRLHLSALELGTGADVVAKMAERATVRVQEGAVSYSFSAANTHEVGALLPPGSYRIRAAAALDHPKKRIAPRKPSRCAVALSADDGAEVVASGELDPEWENE